MKDVTSSSIKKNFCRSRSNYSKPVKVKGASLQRTLRIYSKKGTSGIKFHRSDTVPSTEHRETPIRGSNIGKDEQNTSKQV